MTAKILTKRPRLRYAVISLLVAIVVNLAYSFGSTLIYGPHPECGINPEVGPCDLVGSSLNFAGSMIVPTFILWMILLAVGFIFIWKKDGSKHKLRDSILIALIILFMLFFLLPFIILVRPPELK